METVTYNIKKLYVCDSSMTDIDILYIDSTKQVQLDEQLGYMAYEFAPCGIVRGRDRITQGNTVLQRTFGNVILSFINLFSYNLTYY